MCVCVCVCVCVYVGEAMLPGDEGVWDNYRVKKTLIHSWLVFINRIFRDYRNSGN